MVNLSPITKSSGNHIKYLLLTASLVPLIFIIHYQIKKSSANSYNMGHYLAIMALFVVDKWLGILVFTDIILIKLLLSHQGHFKTLLFCLSVCLLTTVLLTVVRLIRKVMTKEYFKLQEIREKKRKTEEMELERWIHMARNGIF